MSSSVSGNAAEATRMERPSIAKVAGASLAGTTLEFYDHFIYGSAAALVFRSCSSRRPIR